MRAMIVSPYTGTGASLADAIRPLIWDVLGQPGSEHIGAPAMLDGQIPSVNLMLIDIEVTGQQLASVKADNRFFVLEPGPSYNGSALATWLDGKGANGHGVTGSDTAEQARDKLVGYFRSL